jgi:1-acyl-sn-glycerol-3-phosphate acyltransferase
VVVLRLIYNIYAIILFLVTMFLVLPVVLISSFFGRINGGNAVYRVCSLWGDVWFFLCGFRQMNLFDAPHDKSKQYIFVANHTAYFDAAVIVKTVRQRVRVLGKSETAKVPFFGYIYKNAIVTVDRSSPENRAKSVRILKSVLRKGISIFIFPEGTFNETNEPMKDLYDGAFRIAIETQTPIKPILFLDSYDRMHPHNILPLTPGKSRSVFLDEIPVEGLTLKDMKTLKEKVKQVMEVKLIEYKASWIKGKVLDVGC